MTTDRSFTDPATAAMFDGGDPIVPTGLAMPPRAEPPERDPQGSLTPELMALFCECLSESGMVHRAAERIGFSRNTLYRHRRNNPTFAAAWNQALLHARERLADHLLERAIEGSFAFTYTGGELTGHRHFQDSRLAYAMLCRLDRAAELLENGAVTDRGDRFDKLLEEIRPSPALLTNLPRRRRQDEGDTA